MSAAGGKAWTRPGDVRSVVSKRLPALLTAFLSGQEWTPLDVPLRGPGPGEIGVRWDEVQAWAHEWERAAARGPLRVEYRQVGGRLVGSNLLPGRARVDGYAQAWELLGAGRQAQTLTGLVARASASCPRVVPWVCSHPLRALELASDWDRLLATVQWISAHRLEGLYVRQVDVPGVDTKFIESRKGVLTQLLDLELDPSRIDVTAADFAGRHGFLRKPEYVRFRCASSSGRAFSEMTVRAAELTAAPPGVTRAFILENEVTYLAFPLPADAMALFGGGYAVDVLSHLSWLGSLKLTYWGDLDTHGFAILNRLRGRFPQARSMLMDRQTLLAHRSQWVTEATPTKAALALLDPLEQALYQDLVGGTFGAAVRLEQERVSFGCIERALAERPRLTACGQ